MQTIFFSTEQAVQMGEFIASITKQGLAWKCKEEITGWIIEITGF